MNNRINFTGICNIGTTSVKFQEKETDKFFSKNYVSFYLNDDANGRDLSEFETAMKRSNLPDEKDFLRNLGYVNVSTVAEDDNPYSVPKLSINFREIPVNNQTMPIFTYIAKLMLKMSSLSDKDLSTPNSYKYGTMADATLLGHIKLSDVIRDPKERQAILDNAYSPNSVRFYAEKVNHDIQKQMEDYLL